MASNERTLKAFARYDGSGRMVVGSLIWRQRKPKTGVWVEVETAYQCCNPTTTTTMDLR
jgi:hypothetical protein